MTFRWDWQIAKQVSNVALAAAMIFFLIGVALWWMGVLSTTFVAFSAGWTIATIVNLYLVGIFMTGDEQ